jgi:hypothetical protein
VGSVLARFQNRGPIPTLRLQQPTIGSFDMITNPRVLLCCLTLLAFTSSASAMMNEVSSEKSIVNLRLGQRVLVDDGSCPAGQIKEVSGAKMTSGGVLAARKCIGRAGPKTVKTAK